MRARWARWEALLLFGLVLLAVALRVVRLDVLPIFVDESMYTRAAQIVAAKPGPDTWLIMTSQDYGGNPPLFSWLVAPLTGLVSDPLLAARLTSALVGTLGVLGVWATGRALWGATAGLLAGVFYALCPFVLFYSRVALLDGFVATAGAGALYFAVVLSRRGRRGAAVGLGLCLAAGMLTKILAASLLLLPLLAILAAAPAVRPAVRRGALGAIVLGVAPFVAVLLMPYHNDPYSFALHGHLQAGGGVGRLVHTVQGQAARWATGLWLYVTPPVLALGLLGLRSPRRERGVLMVSAWALLGSLPVMLLPNRFFVPRHFVFIAAPIVVLGAHGLIVLAGAIRSWLAVSLPRSRSLVPFLLPVALALAAIPSVAADAAMVAVPTRTPFIPADRFQYVTGWPSGYMLAPVLAYLRRQAAHGPITVLSEDGNPPLLMLRIALYDDPRIAVAGTSFSSALALQAVLSATGRGASRSPRPGIYLIAHYTSDRPSRTAPGFLLDGLPRLADPHLLRLVLRSPSLDHVSTYDVYRYMGMDRDRDDRGHGR